MRHPIQGTRPQPAETVRDTPDCTTTATDSGRNGRAREYLRDAALQNAVRKRTDGVPTYTVAEAAALFSVSQEYLYRLIHAGGFPAIRMRIGGNQGRYVIPAKAVEGMLNHAAGAGHCVDTAEWVAETRAGGGAA